MSTELIVAILSGAVALASAALAIWSQFRSTQLAAELESLRAAEERRVAAERITAKYRDPLARSAYDLQSRLFNIIMRGFVANFFVAGDPREQSYVVNNTVFLIAQYFAWTEIIRTEILFINLGEDEETRQLAHLQDEIYALWQRDGFGRMFRVFAGEQRAVGEQMIRESNRRANCMGYAAFLGHLESSEDPVIAALMSDAVQLAHKLADARPRLAALQNALIDLLEFLDPDYLRFPEAKRTKVPL